MAVEIFYIMCGGIKTNDDLKKKKSDGMYKLFIIYVVKTALEHFHCYI